MHLTHIHEEANKIALVLRISSIVVNGLLYKVALLSQCFQLLLLHALIERIGQLLIDCLVESDGNTVSIVQGKMRGRINRLIRIVMDVDIIRQRLVLGYGVDDKVIAILGVLLTRLVTNTLPVACLVLAAIDAEALEIKAVVVHVDVFKVVDAVVFEIGTTNLYLNKNNTVFKISKNSE